MLGLVAVGGAFMAALLDIVEQTIDIFMGLLNAELNIPFLSWLYRLLFGEPLTMLNAITLIAAIPVTMIYRVSQGSYPFAKLATQSTQSAGALDIGANTILRANLQSHSGADYRHRSRHSARFVDSARRKDPAKGPVLHVPVRGDSALWDCGFTGLVVPGARAP